MTIDSFMSQKYSKNDVVFADVVESAIDTLLDRMSELSYSEEQINEASDSLQTTLEDFLTNFLDDLPKADDADDAEDKSNRHSWIME